jgi:geranylgeranyl diphosphate synthase type I
MFTGAGEFIELVLGLKDLKQIKKEDIYKVYDYKTAYYSFASPLATGAILAGVNRPQVEKIFDYGIYLGRSFQIKDDILGIFGDESEIGKPLLTDLKEGKKTILVYHAYRNSKARQRAQIQNILSKENAGKKDLLSMRRIITGSGALELAWKEINHFAGKARRLIGSSGMRQGYKKALIDFSFKILKPPPKTGGA